MIIDDIIETERKRFAAKGFDVIVTPIGITVNRRLLTRSLSNDCYILTGVRGSDDDVRDGYMEVCLSSANNCLQASIRQLATLGSGICKTFRRTLTIKTLGEKDIDFKDGVMSDDDQVVPTYRLEFIKVTPVRRLTSTTK